MGQSQPAAPVGRVLLIEDNEDDAVLFTRYLQQEQLQVDRAGDALTGSELAAVLPSPDLILLDYKMPRKTGMELVRELKTHQRLKYIPVIMLTGYEQEADIVEALSAGADDYVLKSSDPKIIAARVQAALRAKRQNDEIKEINERLQQTNRELRLANETKSLALQHLDAAVAELRDLSIRDSLTKLYNHGYFLDVLQKEVLRSQRYKLNVSCLMVDIDFFKKINDTHGHLLGDKVLVLLAEHLKRCVREIDVICRYGGEEFAVLLLDAGYEQALMIAERIRGCLAETVFPLEEQTVNVTVSIGCSSLLEDGLFESEKLLEAADRAMYEAKLRGRNCCVASQQLSGENSAESVRQLQAVSDRVFSAEEQSKTMFLDAVSTVTALLEERDPYVRDHSQRVARIAVRLGTRLGLAQSELYLLEHAALIHDIGNVGIAADILQKTGKLSPEEYAYVKKHPLIGVRLLRKNSYIKRELDLVLAHHEWFDGRGYPRGLHGTQIPLSARVLSVAESVDAMLFRRPFRDPLSEAAAMEELQRCSGTQFDPAIVDVVLRAAEECGGIGLLSKE